MVNSKEVIVDIQWLTRWYPKAPWFIFNKFDFKLEKNDFCFILWKSWVGKTTLTKFLVRQLKSPKKMIFYKKEDISRFSAREVQFYRRKIWVIYQDFKLIEWKSVKENILYPLEIAWVAWRKKREKLERTVRDLWLSEWLSTPVPHLSGWEKQRVAIARALISNPEFVIADEPTWNLDQKTSEKIVDILINLNRLWHTILFITHDKELVKYARDKHSVRIVELV